MKQEKAIQYLNGVLSCKMQSLAAYVAEATPFIVERDRNLMDKLGVIAGRSEETAREVAQAIRELDAPPTPGMRDVSVADINYLSLSHLSTLLLKSMQDDLAFMQSGQELLDDQPSAKALIERLLKEDEADCRDVAQLVGEIQRSVEEERAARKRRLEEEERLRQEAEEAEKKARQERLKQAAAAKKAAAAQKPAVEAKDTPQVEPKVEAGDAPSVKDSPADPQS